MKSMEGRKAIVTGASRGIGAGIADELAKAGADVVLTYRRKADEAEALAAACAAHGVRAKAIACEVTDFDSVTAAFAAASEFLGSIDTVIANAGVPSGAESVEELEPRWWNKLIDTNLTGAFHTCKVAVPYLRQAGGGVVLTVSSIAADACAANGVAYNCAKAGLNALTMTLAREVAHEKIRVNAIAPGLIATDMGEMLVRVHGEDAMYSGIPLKRMGTPSEIGQMAVYLAADSGAWITGKIFRIDGGSVIQP
ncbi:MAG: NAD(P)-dependent dehydrogenase (short-subunit alcohol dehydrogenase family) [Hyphomicrobiaceae bacterium]|jgi:NAD(P)-dependent dehydrogenase (short-subunit alcohol dehydrogenase family)